MTGEAGKGYDSTKDSKKAFDEGYDYIYWPSKKCKCGHAIGGDCKGCKKLIKKEKV
jgi:hypothetical protein